MELFETERLKLRKFTLQDSESFFQLNSHPNVIKYIRPAKNREECAAFLKENLNLYTDGSVVGRYAVIEKQTDTIVGTFSYLYLSGQSEMHIGYALLPEAWGKGYATELVKHGIPYFFSKTTKDSLFAITDTQNRPSQLVLLKNGFTETEEKQENGKKIAYFSIQRTR